MIDRILISMEKKIVSFEQTTKKKICFFLSNESTNTLFVSIQQNEKKIFCYAEQNIDIVRTLKRIFDQNFFEKMRKRRYVFYFNDE